MVIASKRAIFLIFVLACIMNVVSGCKKPNVYLRAFDEKPVIYIEEKKPVIYLGKDVRASSTWVIPCHTVKNGEVLIFGRRSFKESTGPFVLDIKAGKSDATEPDFFWLDPDGAKTQLEVFDGEKGTK